MKAPSPLLGFNNNVRHKGRVFHIQTEDSGIRHPHVITHLFADGGRILKTTKTSYAEHIGQERLSETVRAMMQEQHKGMFIALRDGQFDYLFEEGAGPLSAKAPAKPAAPPPAAAPLPEGAAARVPEGAEPKAPPKADDVPTGAEHGVPVDAGGASKQEARAADDAGAPKSSSKAAGEAAPAATPPPKAHEPAALRAGTAAPKAAEAARPAPKAVGHAPASPAADAILAPEPPAPPAAAPPEPSPKRAPAMPPRRPPVRSAPHVPASLADPVQRSVVPAVPAAPLLAEAPASDVTSTASHRRATSRPTLDVDPGAIHGVPSGEPAIDLDLDALERAAAEAQTHVFQQIQDLPPPPASVLGSKRGASGGGYSVRSSSPPPPPPPGRRPATADAAPAAGSQPGRPVQLPPVAPMASQSAGARYAPSRPASIFATTRPQEGASIFGEDLISEKSLDEVILSYLAEDLDGPAEKK